MITLQINLPKYKMAYNIPSRYQPIWDMIKKTNKATIVAPPYLHKRIIKAVTRRKDIDITYKFICAESHKRAVMSTKVEGNTIHFSLNFYPYINSLGAY